MRRIIDSIFGWVLAVAVVFEIFYIFYGLVFYPTSIVEAGKLPLYLLAPLPSPIIVLTFIGGVALLAYVLSVSVVVSASASYSFFGCSECRRGLAKLMGVIAVFSMLEAVIRLFSSVSRTRWRAWRRGRSGCTSSTPPSTRRWYPGYS